MLFEGLRKVEAAFLYSVAVIQIYIFCLRLKSKKVEAELLRKSKGGRALDNKNKSLGIIYGACNLKSMICEWAISRGEGNPFQGAEECKTNWIMHFKFCFSRVAFFWLSSKTTVFSLWRLHYIWQCNSSKIPVTRMKMQTISAEQVHEHLWCTAG